MRKILFITAFLIASFNIGFAQYVPVGTPALEDYYRREQLLGHIDSNISFTVKPVLSAATLGINRDVFYPDNRVTDSSKGLWTFPKDRGYVYLLPVSMQAKINTNYPYGWNDGAMIPAKGPQTFLTGGFFIKYGFLTIQFKPEFVYAINSPYSGFAANQRTTGGNGDLNAYYRYYNDIDQPERLSNGTYSRAFLGQSSIRLNFDPVSIGLSNENLWWGPGIYNSLMLTNNAPGFKHVTVNTTRPIKSFLGHFEGQIIFGRVDGTNLPPLTSGTQQQPSTLYKEKSKDWRYFTGFNLSYQPKWLSGLTFGLTRTFLSYSSSLKTVGDYLPFFVPYQKVNTNDGDPFPRDQRTSFYARWLYPKANAEVYFEFGRNDNSYDYRDFIGSPDHSRAYLFGARKMLPINKKRNQYFLVGFEITQISETVDRVLNRPPTRGGWYTHGQVIHGYTHLGQILGAGGGGNVQTVELSWVAGLKRLGIGIERFDRNASLSERSFGSVNGNSRSWVDVSFSFHGEWDYKNFIFNANLQPIKSLNYQWFMNNYTAENYYIPNNTKYNFYAQLGATYRF